MGAKGLRYELRAQADAEHGSLRVDRLLNEVELGGHRWVVSRLRSSHDDQTIMAAEIENIVQVAINKRDVLILENLLKIAQVFKGFMPQNQERTRCGTSRLHPFRLASSWGFLQILPIET
jgi:hypothetical protein